MLPRINFVGCGKLGKTIAKLLVDKNLASINSVLTRSPESSLEATNFIGQGKPCSKLSEILPSEYYFIASNDGNIKKLCNDLVTNHILKKGDTVIHFSGVHSSDSLKTAHQIGCNIASVHPIKSFADSLESTKSFEGTYCGFEGVGENLRFITELFEKIGGILFRIDKDKKSKYHAACVIANNYLVTLHYHAVESFKSAGTDETIAKKITSSLILGALNNLDKHTHKESLTGPIQRDDKETIEKHILCLQDNEIVSDVYSTLGAATLPITDHSDETKQSLSDLLKRKH